MRADNSWVGDLSGSLAAVLVTVPSSVAFGLIVFGPLGASQGAAGATAGIVGAIVLGIVGASLGGTPRLITAPCAPAAAALGGIAATLAQRPVGEALALLSAVVAICGSLQLLFGFLRSGRLVKFLPYPVVSGFVSAVGFLIIGGQLPKLLALPRGTPLASGILAPSLWSLPGVLVGTTAVALMIVCPRLTKKVPASVAALTGGTVVYFLLGLAWPELLTLEANPLVIGRIEGGLQGLVQHVGQTWTAFGSLQWSSVAAVFGSAAALAVLLSIDTLKTCLVVDAATKARHESNQELIGQGAANLASALLGGISGAGTTGPTLVNLSSGARTRLSGILAGIFAAVIFLLLGSLVAWIPIPAMAGILIVAGFRNIDRGAFKLLKNRETALDFVIMVAVVVAAIKFDLMVATGVGVGLATLLFVRDHIRSSVVRRRFTGAEVFSKKQRLPDEIALLEVSGVGTKVFELQGSLFFGTTDKLLAEVEPVLPAARYVLLDMRRVHAVDFSAARLLKTLASRTAEQGGRLILAHLPRNLPTGQQLEAYFKATGVIGGESGGLVFQQLHDALEWIEDRLLEESRAERRSLDALEIRDLSLFRGLPAEVASEIAACAKTRFVTAGSAVFLAGDQDDRFFVIRRGEVKVVATLQNGTDYHVASFAAGDFFGDLAFLDGGKRSAAAIAVSDVELLEFSRREFDLASAQNPALGSHLYAALARILAIRLRHTNTELHAYLEA